MKKITKITLFLLVTLMLSLAMAACGGSKTNDEYTVKFYDGEQLIMTDTVESGRPALFPDDVTKSGYTLSWKNKDTGAAFSNSTKVTGDISLAAVWTPIDYTIKYIVGGVQEEIETYTIEDTPYTLWMPIIDDAYLDGWYQYADYSGSKITLLTAGTIGDKTVYGKIVGGFEPIEYAVTYYVDGTKVTGVNDTYYEGNSHTLWMPEGRDGSVFNGWYDNAALSGTKLTTIPEGEEGDKTFYGEWIEGYNITYYIGGEVYGTDTYLNDGTVFTLTQPAGTAGYSFNGWYDNPELTGSKITEIPASTSGNKTFYGQRVAITYNITYFIDGVEVTATASTFTTESTFPITLHTPAARPGYVFNGWYTVDTLTGVRVSAVTAFSPYNMVFYGEWREEIVNPQEYSISYYIDGTKVTGQDGTYTVNDTPVILITPEERDGYTFDGWYDNPAFTGNAITAIPAGGTGDKTFYGRWIKDIEQPTEYNISYYIDGVLVAGKSDKYTQEDAFTLYVPQAASGHTFDGWYDNPTFTGVKVTEIPAGQMGDKVFYGRMNAIEYAISYYIDGVKVDAQDDTYTVDDTPVALWVPAAVSGKVFDGWYFTETFGGSAVSQIAAGSTGTKVFWGRWLNENTFTFNKIADKEEYEVLKGTSAAGIIDIPATYNGLPVTKIANRAFIDCGEITQVIMPDSITEIGDFAFKGNVKLKEITFSAGLKSIGADAFESCKLLIDAHLPFGLLYIGEAAFNNCQLLANVTLPSTLGEIDEGAFSECKSLLEITIPVCIPTLGAYLFESASPNLYIFLMAEANEAFLIPSGWDPNWNYKGAGTRYPYEFVSRFIYFTLISDGSGYSVSGHKELFEVVNIPATYKGKPVLEIAENGFLDCELEGINLPNTLKKIGASAFAGCLDLEQIIIPASVTHIGANAFKGCTSLDTVTFTPISTLTNIGASAFEGCGMLWEFVLPSSVTDIGASAFKGCTFIEVIKLADTIINLGASAFSGWTSYQSIKVLVENQAATPTTWNANWKDGCKAVITYGLETIDPDAGTDGLSYITTMVGGIEGYKVSRGSALGGAIVIPAEYNGKPVLEIAANGFQEKTDLVPALGRITSIVIPTTVKQSGTYAFQGCIALEKVVFKNGCQMLAIPNSMFQNCTSLKELNIPESVRDIGDLAFVGTKFTSLELPKGLEKIGTSAFSSCSVPSIIIYDKVVQCGSSAFNNWTKDQTIYICFTEAKVKDMLFWTKQRYNEWYYGCNAVIVYEYDPSSGGGTEPIPDINQAARNIIETVKLYLEATEESYGYYLGLNLDPDDDPVIDPTYHVMYLACELDTRRVLNEGLNSSDQTTKKAVEYLYKTELFGEKTIKEWVELNAARRAEILGELKDDATLMTFYDSFLYAYLEAKIMFGGSALTNTYVINLQNTFRALTAAQKKAFLTLSGVAYYETINTFYSMVLKIPAAALTVLATLCQAEELYITGDDAGFKQKMEQIKNTAAANYADFAAFFNAYLTIYNAM